MRRLALLSLLATGCLPAQAQPNQEVGVLVATHDLAAGTIVSTDDFTRRSMPQRLVTSSNVKPESIQYILKQRMLVPALAGDPILWMAVETRAHPTTIEACTRALGPTASPAVQVAWARAAILAP